METAATSWMFWSSVQLKPTWKEATSGRGEREDPHHAKPDIWTGGRASERAYNYSRNRNRHRLQQWSEGTQSVHTVVHCTTFSTFSPTVPGPAHFYLVRSWALDTELGLGWDFEVSTKVPRSSSSNRPKIVVALSHQKCCKGAVENNTKSYNGGKAKGDKERERERDVCLGACAFQTGSTTASCNTCSCDVQHGTLWAAPRARSLPCFSCLSCSCRSLARSVSAGELRCSRPHQ